MPGILRLFSNSEFKKNLLVLTSGTVLAQTIPIVCAPLMTRLFLPGDFGLYTNFIALAAFVNIFISGKYELAIILPERHEEAVNILSLACVLCLSFTCILSLVFFFFSESLSSIIRMNDLKQFLWLIPISACFAVIYMIFNEWCVRKKTFTTLSKNKISNTTGIAGSSLLFGLFKISGGLIFGEILGRFASASLAIFRVLKDDRGLFRHISISKMVFYAKKYSDFPKFNLSGQFFSVLGHQLPVLLLTAKFGIYDIGLFSLSERVLGLPLNFVGNAFKDVFKQRAANDYRKNGNCRSIYLKTMTVLLCISVIPFFILFLFAPFLFSLVFGKEWYIAGEYARILCPMFCVSFLMIPTSGMFVIAEKQKREFIWQILYFIVTVISLFVGISIGEIKETLICFCAGRLCVYLINIFITYNLAKGKCL
jgi:O-antigen/teichoic acid export membrane protein